MAAPTDATDRGESPVQMVVQLKPTNSSGEYLSPDESAELANRVLNRVAGEVGHAAKRVNILRNVASMVVLADRAFQASLARQPEVASAIPNKMDESAMIPPVRKRKV